MTSRNEHSRLSLCGFSSLRSFRKPARASWPKSVAASFLVKFENKCWWKFLWCWHFARMSLQASLPLLRITFKSSRGEVSLMLSKIMELLVDVSRRELSAVLSDCVLILLFSRCLWTHVNTLSQSWVTIFLWTNWHMISSPFLALRGRLRTIFMWSTKCLRIARAMWRSITFTRKGYPSIMTPFTVRKWYSRFTAPKISALALPPRTLADRTKWRFSTNARRIFWCRWSRPWLSLITTLSHGIVCLHSTLPAHRQRICLWWGIFSIAIRKPRPLLLSLGLCTHDFW